MLKVENYTSLTFILDALTFFEVGCYDSHNIECWILDEIAMGRL